MLQILCLKLFLNVVGFVSFFGSENHISKHGLSLRRVRLLLSEFVFSIRPQYLQYLQSLHFLKMLPGLIIYNILSSYNMGREYE